MVIKPKIRGFICTTAHPIGCHKNIQNQIEYIQSQQKQDLNCKRVLIIGASSGYGLASRIATAFGCDAKTIGVFFEKPSSDRKTGTAGWYNSVAFNQEAHKKGLYSKSINGDAFSHATKQQVIQLIKEDLQQIDLVVYSLASPVRKMPDSGDLVRSCLKPIGKPYKATAVDTNTDQLFEASIDPANEQEIKDTVKVMGGQDWQLWIEALNEAGVLANGCQTVTYSYIGSDLTWPIYWNGTIGAAKMDLDHTVNELNQQLRTIQGTAHVAVLKSVVTQASSAIPVMPLYLAMVCKKMRAEKVHEGCIEQIWRLLSTKLYEDKIVTDDSGRIRLDDWELRQDIQQHCKDTWLKLTNDNLTDLTDYQQYKEEFLSLFGFGLAGVDYNADISPQVESDIQIL